MISAKKTFLLFVTAPDKATARELSKHVLESRLAACCNLIEGVESHYWWKGKLHCETEVLVLMKTSEACLDGLEELVLEKHPDETPEIIAVSLKKGTPEYLRWIDSSVRDAAQGRKNSRS